MKAWNKWLDGIKEIHKQQIDRYYYHHGCQCSDIQLHIFCDAPESAYWAVAYLCFAFKNGTTHCCFVMAKSWLASINGVKCCCNWGKTLQYYYSQNWPAHWKTKFWSGSMLTLLYIQDKSHCFKIYIVSHKYWKAHLQQTGTSLKVLKIQMLFVQEGFSTQTCCIRLISMKEIGWLDQHFCMKVKNTGK